MITLDDTADVEQHARPHQAFPDRCHAEGRSLLKYAQEQWHLALLCQLQHSRGKGKADVQLASPQQLGTPREDSKGQHWLRNHKAGTASAPMNPRYPTSKTLPSLTKSLGSLKSLTLKVKGSLVLYTGVAFPEMPMTAVALKLAARGSLRGS